MGKVFPKQSWYKKYDMAAHDKNKCHTVKYTVGVQYNEH